MRYKFASDKVHDTIEDLKSVKNRYSELRENYRSETNMEQFSIAHEPDQSTDSLLRYILGRYDGAVDPKDIHFSSDEEHFVDIEIQTSTRCIADAVAIAFVRALLRVWYPTVEDPTIGMLSGINDWMVVGVDTWGILYADGILRGGMSYSEV